MIKIILTVSLFALTSYLGFQFSNVFKSKSFKRYVVLSSKNGRGTIEDVYDENFRQVVEFL